MMIRLGIRIVMRTMIPTILMIATVIIKHNEPSKVAIAQRARPVSDPSGLNMRNAPNEFCQAAVEGDQKRNNRKTAGSKYPMFLRTLVPQTIPSMVFGTEGLKCWVIGPGAVGRVGVLRSIIRSLNIPYLCLYSTSQTRLHSNHRIIASQPEALKNRHSKSVLNSPIRLQ